MQNVGWPGATAPGHHLLHGPFRIHGLHFSGKNELDPGLRSVITTDVLASSVISNFFSKTTKVNKEFLADSKYYLPVNHVIIVDCDVSEADGLLHGYASSRRDSAKCLKR